MAKKVLKERAVALRVSGLSYSDIKKEINVSKSTLSNWLASFPLDQKNIKNLKVKKKIQIERYKNTMNLKKEKRLKSIYQKVSKDILSFSKRELFLSGFFLYWGEGTKNKDSCLEFTNTNPFMINFFIKWLLCLGVDKNELKIKLHLYSDMDINKSIDFWVNMVRIPKEQFYKPYIKKTSLKNVNYKNGFGKGTCSVILYNKPLWEYVKMGLKYVQDLNIHP